MNAMQQVSRNEPRGPRFAGKKPTATELLIPTTNTTFHNNMFVYFVHFIEPLCFSKSYVKVYIQFVLRLGIWFGEIV